MSSKPAMDPLLPSKNSNQDVLASATVEPAVVVKVQGFVGRKQALAIQEMLLGWFPKGLKVDFEKAARASSINISVNDKPPRITQTHAKMVDEDDDATRLWPMEKAKLKADIRGWMDDSTKEPERTEVPSQRDSSQDALVTPFLFNTVGALIFVASMFVIIYLVVCLLARGFDKDGEDDDALPLAASSHEEL